MASQEVHCVITFLVSAGLDAAFEKELKLEPLVDQRLLFRTDARDRCGDMAALMNKLLSKAKFAKRDGKAVESNLNM